MMDNLADSEANTRFQRPLGRTTASTALWGHLLRKTGSSQVPSSTATSTSTLASKRMPTIAPIDKAGASTRILLHDTQAHLEKFTDRVTQLTAGVDSAKSELVAVQKLYQNDHEVVMDRISGLANRCQTELQKSIGTPAQSSDVRDMAKDLSHLSSRLHALDKKIDTLSSLNQTQSQALQTIQQQQAQLLTALLPILPLLQTVPLHIENARDRVKDSILELRQEAPWRASGPQVAGSIPGHERSQVSGRSRTRSSGLSISCDLASSPTGRKKRRLDTTLDELDRPTRSPSTRGGSVEGIRPVVVGRSIDQNTTAPPPPPEIPPAVALSRTSPQSMLQGPSGRILRSRAVHVTPSPLARNGPGARTRSRSRAISNSVPHTPVHLSSTGNATHSTVSRSPQPAVVHPSVSSTPQPAAAHELGPLMHPGQHGTAPAASPSGSRSLSGNSDSSLSLMNNFASAATASREIKHENLVRLAHLSYTPTTPITPARGLGASDVGLEDSLLRRTLPVATPTGAQVGGMPPPSSTSKPMSLRDRRAMFAEAQLRDEGKRFIPLDDEDDEDVHFE